MEKIFSMILSGGGAKGAYQVGAFKALSEYDIKIKNVSGSSIGGINALAYALLSLEEIENLWKNFKFDDFINLDDDDLTNGISDRSSLEIILNKIITEEKLKNSIPIFNTICINEYLPEYKLLNNKTKEEAIKILLATSALPVIYSKVNINNTLYQDGGLADNLPVTPLYNNGERNFITISMSDKLRINKLKFDTNNLIEIYPTYNLGDLIDGTLNFNQQYISFAMKLGYSDTKRVLNNYYGISNGIHTPEYDLNTIKQELKVEKIEKDINKNMDYIKNLDNLYKNF